MPPSVIVYILLCLIASGFTAQHFYARLPALSGTAGVIGVLTVHLIVTILFALLLAVCFTVLLHSKIFAMTRFVAAALFFVLPLVLIMFLVAIWLSGHPRLSTASHVILAQILLIPGALLIGTYIYARFVEPYRLETTFYQWHSPKLVGLDHPLRIVLLADIQTDQVGACEKKVFAKTMTLKPDLILFAGDYLQCLDRESYRCQAEKLSKTLTESNLTADLGVFAVVGNSEVLNGTDCFDRTSVQWLIDRSVILEHANIRLCLTGLSMGNGSTCEPTAPSPLENLDRSVFNIVLSHYPDFVLDLPPDHAVDLCLAGHTHGGQICLPFIGALFTVCRIPRAQASGWHQINGTSLCISRGIGMERGYAPRLRFLCRPQIVVIDLLAS